LVVGLGALGQNVLLNLTLSGVGNLLLIDFDEFEDHNATRSPFYPSEANRAALGLGKASVVAKQVAERSTAPRPNVQYIETLVQKAGDGPIRWADVVMSAVDSLSARAWLAERCRLHGKPLVEAGFAGPEFNLVAFSGETGAPCYRCHNSARASTASCTLYALAAEAAEIIPAIQTTAAVVGGLMAEQVIQVLHGGFARFGERLFGDARRLNFAMAKLPVNPKCPGQHAALPVLAELGDGEPLETLADLLHGVERYAHRLMLAEPAVISQSCTKCATMCLVQATESAWLLAPRCQACGGPWPRSSEPSPDAVQLLDAGEPQPRLVAGTPLAELGLTRAGSVLVQAHDDRAGLVTLPGNVSELCRSPRPEIADSVLTATRG